MTEDERAYNSEEFTAVLATANNPGATMAAKVGFAAPEFEASTLEGKIFR